MKKNGKVVEGSEILPVQIAFTFAVRYLVSYKGLFQINGVIKTVKTPLNPKKYYIGNENPR